MEKKENLIIQSKKAGRWMQKLLATLDQNEIPYARVDESIIIEYGNIRDLKNRLELIALEQAGEKFKLPPFEEISSWGNKS